MKKDVQATEAANFKDPDSFVFKDGREWLRGKDWEARKRELWARCGGRCEGIVPFSGLRCWHEAQDPDHVIPRRTARDDRLSNLMALCRDCHDFKHQEKQPQWTKRGEQK